MHCGCCAIRDGVSRAERRDRKRKRPVQKHGLQYVIVVSKMMGRQIEAAKARQQ